MAFLGSLSGHIALGCDRRESVKRRGSFSCSSSSPAALDRTSPNAEEDGKTLSRRAVLSLAGMSVFAVTLAGRVDPAQALSKKLKMGESVAIGNGISYREIKVGEGNSPNQGDTVAIHYSLFCDGIEVETSRESQGLAARPLAFTWGAERGPGSIIRGVPLGMEGMKVGGQRYITVPPEFAFGAKGRPPLIPSNSTVDFAVSLLSVKRAGSNPNISTGKNAVY